MVVGAVDGVDARSVDSGSGELLGLEIARDEDGRLEPLRGRACRDRAGEVPGRRAGERVEPELLRLPRRDRDDAILERVRRVRGVELEPQLADPELLRESRRRDERCHARGEPRLLGRRHRKQVGVAPDRLRACLDRGTTDAGAEGVPVVGRVERAEAVRTRAGRHERVLGRTDAAAKGQQRALVEPPGRRSTSVRDWHLTRYVGQVAEASQGRSLSLSRCGAGRVPLPGRIVPSAATTVFSSEALPS